MDKFLTDLASYTAADSVQVEWRGYWHLPEKRFKVLLGFLDKTQPHGWRQHYGIGATVDDAMAAALASVNAKEAA